MENIFDVRKNEKLLFILQQDESYVPAVYKTYPSVAIGVNLFYEDTVEYYFAYLNKVPEEIDIYIFSSNPDVLSKANSYYSKRKNITVLKKQNRGRDISALLVSFREIALGYQYICFVHDKKEKSLFAKNDVDFWVRNLWENTIGSEAYIRRVIDMLEKNKELGILAPPEPLGEFRRDWFCDTWYENYENTKQLALELQLTSDIRKEKPPITIGTTFWGRTSALKKLLKRQWIYNDFPEEPLQSDGTINHAIERILGYVAQDAGYKTGTIMSQSYAADTLLFLQYRVGGIHRILRDELKIYNLHQVDLREKQIEQIKGFYSRYEDVFLYGAGDFGRMLLQRMLIYGLEPAGFVVTDGYKDVSQIDGYPVYELSELNTETDLGIIIAVGYKLQREMEDTLKKNGYKNYIIGFPQK